MTIGSAPSWVTTQTVSGLLLAIYGPGLNTYDRWIHRAHVNGPDFTTCTLSIGDQIPTVVATDPRYLIDSTPVGAADYGAWDPPLPLPAGSLAVFRWLFAWNSSLTPVAVAGGGVRIEVESQ